MEADENKGKESSEKKEEAAKSNEASKPKITGLKGTRSLRKLRDRVERAAHELVRLREENAALQERIDALEAMPAGTSGEPGGIFLTDTDPETLKRKVEGFIQSIDNYLDKNESSE